MDFQTYLKETALKINLELEKLYQAWEVNAQNLHPSLLPLIKVCIESNKGGKRLRGVLVDLGFKLAGGSSNDEILKVGTAFEVFQTAILAHDDIIDLSPIRRGKPTMYQVLGGEHYGVSQTICLGDIGFFQSLEIISKSNFSDNLKNQATNSFTKTMIETAMGELLDVELSQKGVLKRQEDALLIFKLKTARYTLVGPLHLGAILGGAGEKLLGQIAKFGESLGVAFQIQDDILGVFGDEKILGKSVTSDIEEGKNTLLITEALKNANTSQKEFLTKYYGQGKITKEQLEEIRGIFKATGALEYSQNKALELVVKAKEVIEQMDIKLEQKNLLKQMAEFLVSRSH